MILLRAGSFMSRPFLACKLRHGFGLQPLGSRGVVIHSARRSEVLPTQEFNVSPQEMAAYARADKIDLEKYNLVYLDQHHKSIKWATGALHAALVVFGAQTASFFMEYDGALVFAELCDSRFGQACAAIAFVLYLEACFQVIRRRFPTRIYCKDMNPSEATSNRTVSSAKPPTSPKPSDPSKKAADGKSTVTSSNESECVAIFTSIFLRSKRLPFDVNDVRLSVPPPMNNYQQFLRGNFRIKGRKVAVYVNNFSHLGQYSFIAGNFTHPDQLAAEVLEREKGRKAPDFEKLTKDAQSLTWERIKKLSWRDFVFPMRKEIEPGKKIFWQDYQAEKERMLAEKRARQAQKSKQK